MPRLPEWWDDHLTFLKSPPGADGLRSLARAVSVGSTVERVRRLGGGISTATTAIRLRTRSGRSIDVVLKRFRGDGAPDEWRRLVFAQRLPVPAPEPLALDTHGTWFGRPALVMRRLPGRPYLRPSRLADWVDQIARTQIAIHSASRSRLPASMKRSIYADGWQPPHGIRRTPLVDEVIAKLRRRVGRAISRKPVVAHGDSHPGNLLWTRGHITGVTDWQSAQLVPRGREVAYMRADIVILLGLRAAEMYGDAYERLLGGPVEDLAVWDLVCALDALHWSVLWVHPYREQGADLTHDRARRHALAFVRKSLAGL
jgi:aminoglycoside phosphotransferase (APT) family kinase protein